MLIRLKNAANEKSILTGHVSKLLTE